MSSELSFARWFVGQQFLQNVLGYSTLDAGLAILPSAVFMPGTAPYSVKLVHARAAWFTLLTTGYVFCLYGFLTMLLLWKEGIPYWKVGLAYVFIGIGVGFAATPVARSLTAAVPVVHADMASGDRRPAARPGRGDHVVGPRRTAQGQDESLEDSANLPNPDVLALDVLALEITEELEAAQEQFAAIAEDLKR